MPSDAKLGDGVEEIGDAIGFGIAEQGAIDVDAEAASLGALQRGDRFVVDALPADRAIMHLLVAVEMHRPVEAGMRLILVELLLQEQRIGADGDIFAFGERAGDDLGQFFVQQRLAAGEHHDRRAAFVDRSQGIVHRQPLIENLLRIVDFAAPGASQIAAEQRLKHQHERIALASAQMLAEDIRPDREGLC